MENTFADMIKQYPEIILSTIKMEEPNQNITIYNGDFQLKKDNSSLKVKGDVYYSWFPYPSVRFKCTVLSRPNRESDFDRIFSNYNLFIDGLFFGESLISKSSFGSNMIIEGQVIKKAVFGDRSIPVQKIIFSIPNLREFFGDTTKSITEKGNPQVSKSRLSFKHKTTQILIDKLPSFTKSFESLSSKGGYILLYSGEISKTSGSIKLDKIEETIHCLAVFLSFLNGRRCSPHFLQGITNSEVLWTDFTSYFVDQYKPVFSWPPKFDFKEFNTLWNNFNALWSDPYDRDFINSAVHWYVEANSNSGLIEGSIIMVQTGLELIYNWFAIEKKKLLLGNDAESINASNKIRLVLSQINTEYDVPEGLENLKLYVKKNRINDGVEALVMIRNCIVHSQKEKRSKLLKIDNLIKYEALELGIWYMELALLYILGYTGKYHSRCSSKKWLVEAENYVPWKGIRK